MRTQLKDHCMHIVVHYGLGSSGLLYSNHCVYWKEESSPWQDSGVVCREIFCKRNDVLTHTEEGEGNFVESVRHMRSTVRCKEEQTFCDSNYYFGYATEWSNLYQLVEEIEIPKPTFL